MKKLNFSVTEQSIFLKRAIETFQIAFMEEPERFANQIHDDILKKDYHLNEKHWIANYIIDIHKLSLDDMLPKNPKYTNTARIYSYNGLYFCEKLIRNQKIMDISLQQMKDVLKSLYHKGIGVRLSASSIYIWNGHVKFSILYPSFVASKEEINRYYITCLANLYHLEIEDIREVLV